MKLTERVLQASIAVVHTSTAYGLGTALGAACILILFYYPYMCCVLHVLFMPSVSCMHSMLHIVGMLGVRATQRLLFLAPDATADVQTASATSTIWDSIVPFAAVATRTTYRRLVWSGTDIGCFVNGVAAGSIRAACGRIRTFATGTTSTGLLFVMIPISTTCVPRALPCLT